MNDDKNLGAQVDNMVMRAQELADAMAANGHVMQSGLVLAMRQMIRILWTRLHPPAAEPPLAKKKK